MSTDSTISRADCLQEILSLHDHGTVCDNLRMGQRLDRGNGIKSTAGMSPAGCIEVFEQTGGNMYQLAKELAVPVPTSQFKMAADNVSAPPPENNGPKFKG